MKKVIHEFNLVEIALAIAIIAIGISQILVLFPIGLNTNKEASADNNMADIGEYLMSYLRAGYEADLTRPAASKKFNLPTSLSDLEAGDEGLDVNNVPTAWVPLDSKTQAASCFYRSNNVFLFQQKSLVEGTYIADFSVIAKVWSDTKFDIYLPDIYHQFTSTAPHYASSANLNAGGTSLSTYLTTKNIIRAFNIELSWPAEIPYAEREKKVFRFELFNEATDNTTW